MTQIKICGLRRDEDIQSVNFAVPEFAGFVLSKGRRYVSPEEANRLAKNLLPQIRRVGVFASETASYIARAVAVSQVDVVQLHFDTNESFISELQEAFQTEKITRLPAMWQRIPILIHAVSAGEIESKTRGYPDESTFAGFILDTCKEDQDGGTGHRFPWEPAKAFLERHDIIRRHAIISGGLDASTVCAAIRYFAPMGVDVSSGVETDGMKDKDKIKSFVEQARKA